MTAPTVEELVERLRRVLTLAMQGLNMAAQKLKDAPWPNVQGGNWHGRADVRVVVNGSITRAQGCEEAILLLDQLQDLLQARSAVAPPEPPCDCVYVCGDKRPPGRACRWQSPPSAGALPPRPEPVAFRWQLKSSFHEPTAEEWSHWNDMTHYETAKRCHGGEVLFEFAYADSKEKGADSSAGAAPAQRSDGGDLEENHGP